MSFEALDFEEAADVFETKPREYKGGPKGPRERKEEQVPWDEAFERAWNSESKVMAVQIKPEEADVAKKRVASAARYFGLGYTEGLPKPGRVEGTVILAWKLREVKPRAKKTETPAE